ncbi:two-component system, chemotaxis family, sensor kinase CheA [Desulfonatronum thiosulfatophilum]|uniref:histidine kinase n=1 Tax=Desulfonatronum thiosulfatophilum TaxID=617002 RepID=A0A1G6A0V9_9BACT|nr:hybrid sensor histidine kinase/response regulator [Desulfonatronum thiosulfatophilum]SDB01856.1 two-component system, chemotaxis family, sensor kinase CheA [Desulfonatronum thiosulfatophilum]
MPLSDHEFLLRLRKTFAVEADEYLRTIVRGLVEIERQDDSTQSKQAVEEVFRAAHSMKGAAHTVDMGGIGTVCHSLENIFLALKNNKLTLHGEDYDILQRTVDVLGAMLASPNAAEQIPDDELLATLDQIVARRGDPSLPNPSATPRSKAFPADIPVRAEGVPEPAKPVQPVPRTQNDEPLSFPEQPLSSAEQTDAAVEPQRNPPVATAPEPATETSPALPAPETPPDPTAETIRISARKLDSILLRTEELVSIKLALEQRTQDLADILALLGPWKRRWSQLEGTAKRTSRRFEGNGSTPEDKDLRTMLQSWDWNQSRLMELEEGLDAMRGALIAQTRGAGQLIADLLETTKSVLMFPAAALVDVLPRTVRNIARAQGKEALFTSSGTDIEVDKRILERIKDPLVHLVRNCIDHGLEPPEIRRNHGKTEIGTIRVAFSQIRGNLLQIVVSDDGAGMDVLKIRDIALKRGLISQEEAQNLDEQATLKLILRSGISTSRIITDISGRGLGMAIVLEAVENLGGDIQIQSFPHRGSVFRITLPMSMAGFRGLLVSEYGQTFVLPVAHVQSTLRLPRDAVFTLEGRDGIAFQGAHLPLLRLGQVLKMAPLPDSPPASSHITVVVLQAGRQQMAFSVDAVLNEQEILIKSLGRQLVRVRNVSGAAVLGSGRLSPVLNVNDLLRSAVRIASPTRAAPTSPEKPRLKILVAEDSITSRTLLKNILTAAGYEVRVAVDGAAAWEALHQTRFDLVVSDVEMPELNGFDLTSRIRSDKNTAHLPVVLVTSLESRRDKERGIDVGADAYIVKSSFDQGNLLEVLRRLAR